MRTIIVILNLMILLSCKEDIKKIPENENKIEVKKIIENKDSIALSEASIFFKEFYKKFYNSNNNTEIITEQNNYLSNELIKKIDSLTSDSENLILDYDPFIQGQDYDGLLIQNTIKVIEDKSSYIVNFEIYSNELKYIKFELKRDKNGTLKINNILNDENFY